MSRNAVTPARFDASVLRRHDPVAAAPMQSVLAMLHRFHVDPAESEQESFDAAVANVQPAFYMELVDRAIDECVGYIQHNTEDGRITRRVMRRMTCLLRALHIDDDLDVWYYIGHGLFACTITAVAVLARASDDLASPAFVVRFVDRVSRLLLDGVFRACMYNPERCMQRLTWRSLLATLEAQLVRDVMMGGGVDAAVVVGDQLAHRPRAIPFLHVDDLVILNEFIDSTDSMDVHLAEAWDAPFLRQAASNARDALHAQNMLGLPGRNSNECARLPAGVATHLARFLAPASIPATDLTRQQAAYLRSAERARARPSSSSSSSSAVDSYRSAERPRDALSSLRTLEQAYAYQRERDRVYADAARNGEQ